ncbi:16S rRNA (cytosine(1402)-N(4))-methyltransferase RsmH [Corynebacterium choanae]|uniref:Ribosomal RNA small subunit methyltransferase H n=1 Tax=Corynebacterium choanae TaxID=1862358 RepID=A0A3G6J7J3_9CORY|nr:16S rRNA (cytosine(1402)-N(4))-methyltransferase RsmH [Corynebacterium choanae]AZA13956.1 Ribosomal RNA small subunit methyltransferase H [Corynebacterium choanae]
MTTIPAGEHGHIPVMIDRVTALLEPSVAAAGDTAVIVDCTLGAGGHTEHFLATFPTAHVIGLDRDQRALDIATARLEPYGDRFTAVKTRFDGITQALADHVADSAGCAIAAAHGVAGILFDLGVSSMQLDQPERGFSYARNAPLDMRMDEQTSLTAADIVNTYSHGEIAKILSQLGDERFAAKIASAIVQHRQQAPITDTATLVELIYQAIPAPARRTGGHPAKRTFQALRVAVNSELHSIEQALPAAMSALRVGGRMVVMSYQSHEDKLVKSQFAAATKSHQPPGLPMDLPGHGPQFSALTRGALQATDDEIAENPRAKPVRVRAIEKLRE